jgi:hypothetical protein
MVFEDFRDTSLRGSNYTFHTFSEEDLDTNKSRFFRLGKPK